MPDTNDKSALIQFEQFGCRGFCPSYKLTFFNNGVMAYEGLRNVALTGPAEKNITAEELRQLKAQVLSVNLWQYPEKIESQVADAPYASMTVTLGDKSHAVSGSIDRPRPILDLEASIKNLAEAHGLSVKRGVDPNALPEQAPQLIVKLKDDINAGNWIMAVKNVKLSLVRRLSAENTWLIAFDATQISAEKLIEALKAMKEVIDVQRNDKVTDRN